MNRIELVGFFKAMDRLADAGDLDGLKDVIKSVLAEAQSKNAKDEDL